jgi:hypothetical protein
MKKIDSTKPYNIPDDLVFSYFTAIPYLDFTAYTMLLNDEQLITLGQTTNFYWHNSMFLPKKKENWERCGIAFATMEDIEDLKKENIRIFSKNKSVIEFFFHTKDFLEPQSKFLNKINRFRNSENYSIFHEYDKEKIQDFYTLWRKQRRRNRATLQEDKRYFNFLLDNLEKYQIKQLYVEVGGELIGLAWGVVHPSGNWVDLHLKVDYRYKGLSRFLQHERAKLFKDYPNFSVGTNVYEKGIEEYKREFHPYEARQYFFVLTGSRRKTSAWS